MVFRVGSWKSYAGTSASLLPLKSMTVGAEPVRNVSRGGTTLSSLLLKSTDISTVTSADFCFSGVTCTERAELSFAGLNMKTVLPCSACWLNVGSFGGLDLYAESLWAVFQLALIVKRSLALFGK